MFSSPIHGFKVFLVSLILCVSSSAIIHLSVFWFLKVNPSTPLISLSRDLLGVLAIGIFVGLIKSLMVSFVTYSVKPSLRWWLILGSTIVLSLIEGWLDYESWTWTFPFG